MGKASRWLKGIFGMKKTLKDKQENQTKHSNDRKRASIGGTKPLYNNPATTSSNITPLEVDWLKSYYQDSEKEQSKHAIAVAAATAAAADAAVAAAQAAIAVVRLTNQGPTLFNIGGGGGNKEKWAALKIQTIYRGYLAKKALRALKGLVKIQALVRGFLVRKQATATFLGMQALIRAQATVKSRRARAQAQAQAQAQARITNHNCLDNPQPEFGDHIPLELIDDTSDQGPSVHSKRLSSSFESKAINPISEDIPKIVEVDPGRPRPSSSRRTWRSNDGQCPGPEPDPLYPAHISIPGLGLAVHESQSRARMVNPGRPNPGPVTPCKNVCEDNNSYFLRNYGTYNQQHPNYMANTQSFRAKLRSQSAPKQRPEMGYHKKRMSLNEIMESRNSLSGVNMQRTCTQVQDGINFKNVVMGKLGRSYDFGRESEVYHLQKF